MQEYVVLWNYKPHPDVSILLRSGDKLTSQGGYLPRDVLIRVVRADGEVIQDLAPVFLDRYTAEIRAGEPEIEVKSGQEIQIVIEKRHHGTFLEEEAISEAISLVSTRRSHVQYRP